MFAEIFGEVEGVEIYINDALIWLKDTEIRYKRLKLVLGKVLEKY